MAKQRKMVNLAVEETSGVDHPAHLHEGWVILKQADQAGVADIIDTLTTSDDSLEDIVPENTETVETLEVEINPIEAELTKANERISELEAIVAEHDAVVAPAEDTTEELMKSVPAAVREMLAKAQADTESVREELRKEREVARDREYVAKASEWTALTMDAQEVGPMLRQLSDVAPALAENIEKMLSAVNAQAESAEIFAEIGSPSRVSGDTYSRVESLAKAKVAGGESKTMEQAIASVIADNPDLYNSYLAEQRA